MTRPHLIREQSFRAPFHLSKPYWDEHALVVQVVNPTAGVFAGDTLRVALQSKAARGCCSRRRARTASARSHQAGRWSNSISPCADGGWLEVMPELFIPQAHCRYRQHTSIKVAAGGEMLFVETLAPGRVARGGRDI